MSVKISKSRIAALLPPRRSDSCKRDYGRLLVIAGSRGMSGAASLCARAALKSGAGVVTVATPQSQQPVVAASAAEIMTLPLPESAGAVSPRAVKTIKDWVTNRGCDLVLVGPGLGLNPGTVVFVRKILKELRLPAVIDADALNAISLNSGLSLLRGRELPAVLTPHPGEMRRLLGRAVPPGAAGRAQSAKSLADAAQCVAVLKGGKTVVAWRGGSFVNPTGGPALAKAGTGDVLAGFVAGLWAQFGVARGFSRQTGLDAALAGVYLHGLCGDLAAEKLTERCVLAGELAEFLPEAIKTLG